MRRILPALLGFFAIFLTTTFIFRTETKNVSAALATHLVISEVQIAGGTTTDEFVELYNPTNNPQGMTGWTIYRKTPTGTIEIPIATGSGSIPSHGFYLFANSNFDGGVSPDTSYTENIAAGNSIILRDNGNVLVDLVGMGASATSESATIADPITNRSIERKANSSSTEADMGSGGVDETAGNGEDTDNNSVDFVRHVSPNVSQPQNSLSAVELVEVSPTPTLTPTPTEEPSPTPSPSPTPTPEPSASPTPTPTIEPTPTPTVEPTPTLIPTPTIPAPRLLFRGTNISCSLNYKVVRFFRSNIFWPFLTCSRT